MCHSGQSSRFGHHGSAVRIQSLTNFYVEIMLLNVEDMNRDSDKDIKIWLASGGANTAKPILLQLNCRKITVSFDA